VTEASNKPAKYKLTRSDILWITVLFVYSVLLFLMVFFVPGARG